MSAYQQLVFPNLTNHARKPGSRTKVNRVCDSEVTYSDNDIIRKALDILAKQVRTTPYLTSPKATRDFLTLHYAGMEYEVFTVIFLNHRHRVLAVEDMFRGTIDEAPVYCNEVAKRALQLNASALIVSHCHPSGDSTPSASDELITRKLKSAMDLLNVRLLDHIVVGGSSFASFAERGLL